MKKGMYFKTSYWKNYSKVLLLFFLFVLQHEMFAQQFVNITVTWIGGRSNLGKCDDQGVACNASNPFNTDPDPRWKVAGKLNSDLSFPGYTFEERADVGPGDFIWSHILTTKTNTCASEINLLYQTWEEDCGANDEWEPACGVLQEDDNLAIGAFTINFLGTTQNADHDVVVTMGDVTSTIRFNWNAAAGPGAPTVANANPSVCGASGRTNLSVTSAPAAGYIIRWYSNVGLTSVLGTGSTLSNVGAGTYYVAQWNGFCNGASSTVIVKQEPAITPPNASSNGPVCIGTRPTLSSTVVLGPNQVLNWSTDPTLTPIVATGTPAQPVTAINTSTTYYAFITNTVLGCNSAATATVVDVSPKPNAPLVNSPVATCLNGQAILVATTGGANGSFNWYSVPTGGGTVWNGPSYQTPPVSGTATFYVSEVDPITGCESDRVAIVVNSDLDLTAPTATASPASVCSGGSTSITAAGAGGVFYWYSDAAMTDLLFIGNPFNPTNIAADATYYVAEKQGTCTSPTAQVDITVNITAASPDVSGVLVCEGNTATLSGAGANGEWSTDPNFINVVANGDSYVTPVLSQTTTYYVRDNSAPCPSIATPVTVSVTSSGSSNPIAVVDKVCLGSGATIRIATTSNGTVTILDNTGAVLGTVPVISAPTTITYNIASTLLPTAGTYTFLVTQAGSGCLSDTVPVSVVVNPAVVAPTARDITICQGGRDFNSVVFNAPSDVVTLSAAGTAGSVITWYNDSIGTRALQVGSYFVFPTNVTPGLYTFWVGQTLNGCQSPKRKVTLTVYPLGGPLSVTPYGQSVCFGGNGEIEVDLTGHENSDILWTIDPSVLSPGNFLNSDVFVTPPVYNIQSYYFIEINEYGCVSRETNWGVAVVEPTTPNVVNAVAQPACVGQPINATIAHWGYSGIVSIIDYAGNYQYYDVFDNDPSSPGTTQVVLPAVATAGQYSYAVKEEGDDCSIWSTFIVTVNDIPAAPTANNDTICLGESASLSASCSGEIRWYSDAALNNLLQIGTVLNVGAIATTTTYYATCSSNGCQSAATEVKVVVNPAPSLPYSTKDYSICLGQTIPAGEGLIANCADDVNIGDVITTESFAASSTLPMIIPSSGQFYDFLTFDIPALPAGAVVTNITVSTDIAHSWVGDLGLYLYSAENTEVTLLDDEDILGDNFGSNGGTVPLNYTFDDNASTSLLPTVIADYDIPAGSYIPQASLNALIGENLEGTWYLDVYDFASGDGGVISAASINITYTLPGNPSSLTWWSAATGGTQVGTGSPFVPTQYDTLAPGSYTYYAQCVESACGNNRKPVVLNVLPAIAKPIVKASSNPICAGEMVTLTVTNPAAIVEWYSDAALTTIIHNGPVFTTQPLDATTTYYVVNNNGTCNSPSTAITVTVNPKPEMPVTDLGYYVTCFDDYTVITASNSNNDEIRWYLDPLGINEITGFFGFDGNGEFTTPELASYTRFYFDAVDETTGCHSDMSFVDVYTTPKFEAPRLEDIVSCESEDSITMTAHVTFPFDLVTDGYDVNYFLTAVVQFYDITGTVFDPFTTAAIRQVQVALDPFSGVYEATATVTIPKVGATYDFSAPGVYNIGAMTSQLWFTPDFSDLFQCNSDVATATITIVENPEAPIAMGDSVCSGGNVVLNATGADGAVFTWYDTRDLSHAVQVGAQYNTPNLSTTTTYYVTQTVNGCVSPATPVEVVTYTLPAPVITSEDITLCERDNASFCATSMFAGAVFHWTGPNGFESNSNCVSLSNVDVAQSGYYYVSVTVGNCSSDMDSIMVTVNPAPKADSITTNAPICEHQTLELNAFAPVGSNYAYSWSGPNGFTSMMQNPTVANVTEVQNQGFYTLTITDTITKCMSVPKSIYVEINAFPDKIIATNDGPVCEGGIIKLNATNVFDGVYTWTGPNGYTATGKNPELNPADPSQTGTYTVTITLPGGCVDSATTDVIVRANPIAHAGNDTTIVQGTILQLHGTSDDGPLPIYPGVTFNWTPSELLNYNNVPNPYADFTEIPKDTPVVFIFTIWDKFGCTDKDTLVVHVIPSLDLIIPDIITPNGDGLNDTWHIDHIDNLNNKEIPYLIQIFARGGALLYTTNAYDNSNGFNGTYKGTNLPDGAYWYVITTPDKTYKGAIHIKR